METEQLLLNSYAETAVWSSTTDDGTPLDYSFSVDDIGPETLETMKTDVLQFVNENLHLLSDAPGETLEQMAHDFWLTRNDHGAGFWDGDYVNGDELTTAAKKYGQYYLYVGDDGKVHGERC